MKKITLLSIALIFSTSVLADRLANYEDVSDAITKGKKFHVVIDFNNCITSNHAVYSKSVNIGMFTPDAAVVTDHIATSITHFTLDHLSFPGKPVYEFEKLTLASNNKATFIYQLIDAINFAPLSEKVIFNCELDAGVKIYT